MDCTESYNTQYYVNILLSAHAHVTCTSIVVLHTFPGTYNALY